ncbi:MAG: DUF3857 domain-containing protein [Candidatus Krumholzibacteria bacterium]|nr:DUF3857 domain-containing protein [Candidatus Krumholzibacteria bacterium]MDH4338352.1 DUF3857 domain-containing protein [Candidatus Krumholzibacteria bacterium]MDH5269802.1 DUF3857 domain-containing protein [Candidatus Krumholzibacteria bacterium]
MRATLIGGAMLLAAAALAPALPAVANEPRVGPEPGWVIPHQFPAPNEMKPRARSGASNALLYDFQHDVESQTSYIHTAVQIVSHEGVQQLSDLTIDYDPSFETLTLHRLRLHRGGMVIDKLGVDRVQTFQRETNMERYMYDGSLTASIHLSDVRVGDIIEYAYSQSGQNPAYDDHDFGNLWLDSMMPIELWLVRIRVPDGGDIVIKHHKTDLEPEVTQAAGYTDYQWKREQLKGSDYDNHVPGWYMAQEFPMVKFTDFANWGAVAAWAVPLFAVSEPERARLREMAGEALNFSHSPENIMQAIHFVQDEVRYLGLLEGMSAYVPHPPTRVWEQRYGDCKDKSLLLSVLLEEMGVDAYPMLVNTAGPRSADEFAVAPGDFDHCVVAFRYGDEMRFVDPTASHQGGDLDQMYFPDYRFGLIVAPDSDDLTPLPEPRTGRTVVTEHFRVDDAGGADLTVKTEYRGSRADMIRFMFAYTDLASIQKQYLSYYAAMYPQITATADLSLEDQQRDSDNVVVVNESYRIDNIWIQSEEDTSVRYVEFFPLSLDNETLWNSSPDRTMPYEVGRIDFRHEFIIDPPGRWPARPQETDIKGKGFRYWERVSTRGDQIRIEYEYSRTRDYIDAADVADFIARHDRIRSNLTYHLIRGRNAGASGISWGMVLVALASLAGSLWGARRLYARYDPEPRRPERADGPAGIRGWLLLPVIGTAIAPLRDLASISDLAACFDAEIVSGFGSGLTVILGFEVVFLVAGAVAWGLMMWLFYRHRSSVPRMFMLYVVARFVYVIADNMLAGALLPAELRDLESTEPLMDIFPMMAFGAVWITYFHQSDRVKRTFVARGPLHQPPPALAANGDAPAHAAGSADELEELARARLEQGIPAAEVAAWLAGQGLSPAMAATVVKVLGGDAAPVDVASSRRARIRAIIFVVIMLIIIVFLARLNM